MTMYATLEEAIDAAREEFLADNPSIDAENANVQQFNAQKYVLQDGDIMWQVEFFADEGEEGECLPSHRWIPRKDAQQLMSGMNVNHSYGP